MLFLTYLTIGAFAYVAGAVLFALWRRLRCRLKGHRWDLRADPLGWPIQVCRSCSAGMYPELGDCERCTHPYVEHSISGEGCQVVGCPCKARY